MLRRYSYLMIGGQMTAAAAIGGIRELDRDGTIGVIGAEPHMPYDRPPLSKGLWKGNPVESIWRKVENQAVTFHPGRIARQLDLGSKRVTDDQGDVYEFTRLLLATGCRPRRLPFAGAAGGGGDQVIYFRTFDDYRRLRALSEEGRQFVVIGGGFVGSELAAALAMNGKHVVMAFPDEGIGGRMFPAELSRSLNDFYRQKGVEVLAGSRVIGCESRPGKTVVSFHGARAGTDRQVVADGVVAGIGVVPNVELAAAAGLAVDNGIRVDATLRTSDPDVFAAGDVASFHNPALNQWLRVEHEDNANTMGRLAGMAMAGGTVSYDHLPFFYSDLFELGYEAVGEVDSRLEMVSDWKDPCREGVVYYLRDGRVRGVLLWSIFGQVDNARRLIALPGPFGAADLKGRLPA